MEKELEIRIQQPAGYSENPSVNTSDEAKKTAEYIIPDIEKENERRSKWCTSSKLILQDSEEQILSTLKTPYHGRYVNVGPVVGEKDCKIWTVSFNENSKEIPLVLVHGFGAGVGFWALNLLALSQSRPVHAIDLLGFARSSRPKFSSTPEQAENEFVDSIEAWRIAMKLEKFAIAGHSFGGYLSTCYSIRFPGPVGHLILADPWGFKEKSAELPHYRQIPLFARVLIRVLAPLNPLSPIRLLGSRMGPKLIHRRRTDIVTKFQSVVDVNDMTLANYIYHCNAQNPTGESAFHSLQTKGWAKSPLGHRLDLLDKKVPITLIYGSRSWIDHLPPVAIKEQRPSSYVADHVISGAGHHVYSDNVEEFNKIVSNACNQIKVN